MAEQGDAYAAARARQDEHLRAYARQRAMELTRPYRRRAMVIRVAKYAAAVLSGALLGAVAAGF